MFHSQNPADSVDSRRLEHTTARNLLILAAMRVRVLLGVPCVLTWAATSFASVMVLPVKATNLDAGAADAIGEVVASAYQAEAKEATIAPAESQKAVDENGGYSQAAHKLGAREYVYVTAVRLETHIVITATRYDADGHYVFSSKMTAATLDDIEPASERLAKALINRQSAEEARTLGNVTQGEQTQPTRVGSQKIAGFKGSVTYPTAWSDKVASQVSGAFDLRLENGMHFIEMGLGLTFAAPGTRYAYGGLWLDLGADWYLMDTSTAPYVGLGVMPRLMGDSLANVAPYVQGGVMFFRESSTRFYTDFRVAQNVVPVGFDTHDAYGGTVTTKRLYPTEFTFSIGMGF